MPLSRSTSTRRPVFLDCQGPDTAIRSLADASTRSENALTEAILSYEIEWDTTAEDFDTTAPREVFKLLDLTDEDFIFDGTCFFHGTRTLDPSRFIRDGVLPLGHFVEQIWSDLYSLVSTKITTTQWRDHRTALENGHGGQAGHLYRLKTQKPAFHGGPYAYLVREQHLFISEDYHDYLATPEIIQDIARTCDFDLQEIYENAAQPCIVKFRTIGTTVDALHATFWYIYLALRGEKPGWLSMYGHDCRNTVVSPEDVLGVDLVSASR